MTQSALPKSFLRQQIHNANLYQDDCLNVLKYLETSSIDSIVTDPPYGISFMAKKWDYDVPSEAIWRECLRVLKPGGHLLCFAGTRTHHRMAARIEDAGFQIRDMIAWVYGSGFPKSHNLQDDWQGWGTALKPALEPITMARKPLEGTVAANVLQWGTGGINVDGCRVAHGDDVDLSAVQRQQADSGGQITRKGAFDSWKGKEVATYKPSGRWPANLIHDGSEEVLAGFPQAPGQSGAVSGKEPSSKTANAFGEFAARTPSEPRNDTGSAARFFYCAKASKQDREDENHHPTVKPTDLMRYLCRMVTPPNGIVLDPFMGSGSTGKAAMLEGFQFIGIEREAEYFDIACARIERASQGQSTLW